jgi:hypothetical protein
MDNTPNYALVVRAAAFTWEANDILLGSVQSVGPINVEFNGPVDIVSVYPSLAYAAGANNLAFPTLDDIYVQIERDNGSESRLTSRYNGVGNNGIAAAPQVTLGSYRDTTGGARIFDLLLGRSDGAKPSLQVTFSWKRPVALGTIFQDVYVGLTFNVNIKR